MANFDHLTRWLQRQDDELLYTPDTPWRPCLEQCEMYRHAYIRNGGTYTTLDEQRHGICSRHMAAVRTELESFGLRALPILATSDASFRLYGLRFLLLAFKGRDIRQYCFFCASRGETPGAQ